MNKFTTIPQDKRLSIDDERDITAVIIRYATAIDSRDWTLFRSCFASDCRADYGSIGTWTSGDEITAVMETMHDHVGTTLHRMTNIVINSLDDGVRVRTYVDAILAGKQTTDPFMQATGYYDDDFVKSSEGWRISHRNFTAVRIA